MINLPAGFPMYCRDLKHMLDEKAMVYDDHFMSGNEDLQTRIDYIKAKASYPAAQHKNDEHHALNDARWDQSLHKFLLSL